MPIVLGLDTETTGLEWLDGHKIIELCLQGYDLDTQEKKFSITKRFDPERSIQAKASEVHGIFIENLKGEPVFKDVASKLQALFARADYYVAHNGEDFDIPFLEHEFKSVGLLMPRRPLVDTMKAAPWATSTGKIPSLQELCFACGVEYDTAQAHAAEYDVDVMMRCFFAAHSWGHMPIPLLKALAA